MTTPEPPTEPQQQCYELMAHCKKVAAELAQARFENEVLQRRLAEYASENQRLRDAIGEYLQHPSTDGHSKRQEQRRRLAALVARNTGL
jgi:L-serine deaminase